MTTYLDDGDVRLGWLHLDGWAGRSRQRVLVVGETPRRYRILAEQEVRLAGRSRYLRPGETALVPKHAVTFSEAVS